ncbi:MAG: sigma-70 family RNA polymerase sigma factor [Paludisphaera borealis]|uniref:RNA polymerase sigma factor n=1 Tax=Paludisphaera borealis TaxID=1387353 RepID=UPI002847EC9F|nr:sigma-70 family RNA polymerase sigma factor [Paludisphaera borealis]MDR3621978.1 sigma-70 family RNA polymerase sigma factor [Paludisphaera borealis]
MSTTVATHDAPSRLTGFAGEGSPDRSDEALLDRYLSGGESDADEAFRELMFRHGPMVLAVCRQALNGSHDAEDAFQATFLTLARKAATIRDRRYLAGWLCEVAHRIAVRSRGAGARRRAREAHVLAMADVVRTSEQENQASREEIRPLIQEEVRLLPEKYRAPVVLSYFEGKSNEEVAELLQWPVGTVKGRLSRAREMLRSRLKRRGLALSTAFLLYALETESSAATPIEASLVNDALRTSLGPRSTPDASNSSEQAARKPASRRLLFYLLVLATAASVFGYEYRDFLGSLKAADIYDGAIDLVPFSMSSASACH